MATHVIAFAKTTAVRRGFVWRHWIVTTTAERMAARQSPESQPASSNHAVDEHCLTRVIGARRQEATRPCEERRKEELVNPQEYKDYANGNRLAS